MTRQSRLTLDQEAVVRAFIAGCEATDLRLPGEVFRPLYDLMGYKIAPNGARVHKDVPLKHRFGTVIKDIYEDTFYEDWQEITDAQIRASTGTSVPSEGD